MIKIEELISLIWKSKTGTFFENWSKNKIFEEKISVDWNDFVIKCNFLFKDWNEKNGLIEKYFHRFHDWQIEFNEDYTDFCHKELEVSVIAGQTSEFAI
jgi:hypothetical protein